MGHVYRAEDTKLKRSVAPKVLPSTFFHDAERLVRFHREAEVLAQLNHPNIAQIYGAEDNALVMELVQGESPKGPLPFEEAWNIAAQIAEALEYAHEKGVIHRDLKPANVMVTPEGVVKLLDFGLAKAFSDPSGSNLLDSDNSAGLANGTVDGVILGTPAYMSPEQARGKRVDRRTDIWSWGVVFYELLTGERLFRADSFSETLVQVLTKQPDLERVPGTTRRPLQSCLEKDPKQRLRDIGDVARLLEPTTTPLAPEKTRGPWIPAWSVAVAALLLAGRFAMLWFTRSAPPAPALRYDIAVESASNVQSFAVSPDGHYVVIAADVKGRRQLWLPDLNALAAQPLSNTDDASSPFWSPDSRQIGFFARGELNKIAVTGGPVVSLCEVVDGQRGTWNRQDQILFSRESSGSPIQRVSASGGMPVDVVKGDDLSRYPIFPSGWSAVSLSRERGLASKNRHLRFGHRRQRESPDSAGGFELRSYARMDSVFTRQHRAGAALRFLGRKGDRRRGSPGGRGFLQHHQRIRPDQRFQ
jgi:serine/threonine protein kinase